MRSRLRPAVGKVLLLLLSSFGAGVAAAQECIPRPDPCLGFCGTIDNGCGVPVECEPCPAPRDAWFINQTVPPSVGVGQTFTASITLENRGLLPWDPADQYFLGSQGPANNQTWGVARVDPPGVIASGERAIFELTLTAPAEPGVYGFEWQMLEEHVAWFGHVTPHIDIQVTQEPPNRCGNGVPDEGEDCSNCPGDLARRPTFTFWPTAPIVNEPTTLVAEPSLVRDAPPPLWDLGNADHRSGSPLIYRYPSAGTYRVVLTATEANCGTTQLTEQYVTVRPPPDCDFTGVPPPRQVCCGNYTCDSGESEASCPHDCARLNVHAGGPYTSIVGRTIQFQATVNTWPGEFVLAYWWDLGPAGTSSEASPVRTFDTHGEFTVNLTVTTTLRFATAHALVTIEPCFDNEACETGEGRQCADCADRPLCGNLDVDPGETCQNCPRDVVGRPQPMALPPQAPAFSLVTFLVPPDQVDPSLTPLWDFENGTTRPGNPVLYSYPAAGNYTVAVTTRERNCGVVQRTTLGFQVHEPLQCDFSDLPPELRVCCGNGNCDSGENAQDCRQDCANPLVVDLGPPRFARVGEPVHFQGSVTTDPGEEVLSRLWSFGDGAVSSEEAPSHVYHSTGVYTAQLTVVSTGRLFATGTTRVTIDAYPFVDDAGYVDDDIPPILVAGQRYEVTVRVKNTGTSPWTDGSNGSARYALVVKRGRVVPLDFRVSLPSDQPVDPEDPPVEFRFALQPPYFPFSTVPPLPPYDDWITMRMVREDATWFGPDFKVSVQVRQPGDPGTGTTRIRIEPVSGPPGTLVTVRRLEGPDFGPNVSGRFSFGTPRDQSYSRVPIELDRRDGSTLTFVVPAGTSCGDHFFSVPSNLSNFTRFAVTSPCNPSRRGTLDVLTYNIQFLPDEACFFVPYAPNDCAKDVRLGLLIGHPDLHHPDVLVLQEAFSDFHRELLISGLRAHYPHSIGPISIDLPFCHGANTPCQDGGVVIMSKWPIEAQDEHVYSVCSDFVNCHSQKGVLYAHINKAGQRYHVFGTHLDSEGIVTRLEQLEEMAAFIDRMSTTHARGGEPVIMAGDFNIDKWTGDFAAMLSTLRARQPLTEGGEYTTPPRPEGQPAKWLDYVLFSYQHLEPSFAKNIVVKPRDPGSPYEETNLSDHYAVLAPFRFPVPEVLPPRAAAPPAAPSLTAPLTGTTGDPTPTFSWTAAPGADAYTLSVATEDNRYALLEGGRAGTSFTPQSPLPTGINLLWTVRGHNHAGPGPESAAQSLRVDGGESSPPTEAPAPAVPAGPVQALRPTFSWSPVDRAVSYSLRAFTASGDVLVLDQTRIFGTSFAPLTDLPANEALFWTVRADSPFGPGPASERLPFAIAPGGNPQLGITEVWSYEGTPADPSPASWPAWGGGCTSGGVSQYSGAALHGMHNLRISSGEGCQNACTRSPGRTVVPGQDVTVGDWARNGGWTGSNALVFLDSNHAEIPNSQVLVNIAPRPVWWFGSQPLLAGRAPADAAWVGVQMCVSGPSAVIDHDYTTIAIERLAWSATWGYEEGPAWATWASPGCQQYGLAEVPFGPRAGAQSLRLWVGNCAQACARSAPQPVEEFEDVAISDWARNGAWAGTNALVFLDASGQEIPNSQVVAPLAADSWAFNAEPILKGTAPQGARYFAFQTCTHGPGASVDHDTTSLARFRREH